MEVISKRVVERPKEGLEHGRTLYRLIFLVPEVLVSLYLNLGSRWWIVIVLDPVDRGGETSTKKWNASHNNIPNLSFLYCYFYYNINYWFRRKVPPWVWSQKDETCRCPNVPPSRTPFDPTKTYKIPFFKPRWSESGPHSISRRLWPILVFSPLLTVSRCLRHYTWRDPERLEVINQDLNILELYSHKKYLWK